jgi:DNA-binding transcriptional ArsR family regulator
MEETTVIPVQEITWDALLAILSALANPHRLRIIAALARERNYVSQLARELKMGRPLLHMHLQRLEAAGLISGELELSSDGKAMRYVIATPFAVMLSPETIARAVETLQDVAAADLANGSDIKE